MYSVVFLLKYPLIISRVELIIPLKLHSHFVSCFGQSIVNTFATLSLISTMASASWESSSRFTAVDMLSDDNGFPTTDDESPLTYPGDYSAHMEELFEGDETGSNPPGEETDEDEADFIYSGVDADASSASYRAQLRDVLGQDHEDGSESDALEVEKSLVLENAEEYSHHSDKTMVGGCHFYYTKPLHCMTSWNLSGIL
jgi:hypothetical protein